MSWLNRILVVRPDRMGDVILSTPVIDALRARFPDSRISVLVRETVVPLFQSHPEIEHVLVYRPDDEHRGLKGITRLVHELVPYCFGTALVLQDRWQVSLAIAWAGISQRVGPASKWSSFLFFNNRVRQRRSVSDRNEADYNLELAATLWGGAAPSRSQFPARVFLPASSKEEAQDWLKARDWDGRSKLVVVHPGMGGSALNWPIDSYGELIDQLLAQGCFVVVSSGPQDQDSIDLLRARWAKNPASGKLQILEGESLSTLGGVLSQASVVIAPSTGPLHLAAALGRPVLGIYPPIPVQSARRWGPFVKDPGQAHLLTPSVPCPVHYRCRGARCRYFDCMQTLTVGQAMEEIRRYL